VKKILLNLGILIASFFCLLWFWQNLFSKADINETVPVKNLEEERVPIFYLKAFIEKNTKDQPELAYIEINFAKQLEILGCNFINFSEDSLKIEERNDQDVVINANLPFYFEKSPDYNEISKPAGTIYLPLLDNGNPKKVFYIYFSSKKVDQTNKKSDLRSLIKEISNDPNINLEDLKKKALEIIKFFPEPKDAPQFESFRGIYYFSQGADFENDGYKQKLRTLKDLGLNAILIWVTSLDMTKSLDPGKYPELQENYNAEKLTKLISEARNLGMRVYYWYSPHGYKNPQKEKAIELLEHPEWTWKDRNLNDYSKIGPFTAYGIDMAIPEARQYEVELITRFFSKFPVNGLIVEEPYYYGDLSYSDTFRQIVKENFGFDPLDKSIDAKKQAEAMRAVREKSMKALMKEIKEAFSKNFPTAEILINAPRGEVIPSGSGINVPDWIAENLFDHYSPMIYDTVFSGFLMDAKRNLQAFSSYKNIFAGVAFLWSGYNDKILNPALINELDYIEKSPFSGFILFASTHIFLSEDYKNQAKNILNSAPKIKKTLNGLVVKGKVLNKEGKPISGATLKIDENNVWMDKNGNYVYYLLPGKHRFEVKTKETTLLTLEEIINTRRELNLTVDDSKIRLPKIEAEVQINKEGALTKIIGDNTNQPRAANTPSPKYSPPIPIPSPSITLPTNAPKASASLEIRQSSGLIFNFLNRKAVSLTLTGGESLKTGDLIKINLLNSSPKKTYVRLSLYLYKKTNKGQKLAKIVNFRPVAISGKKEKTITYKLPGNLNNIKIIRVENTYKNRVFLKRLNLLIY